MKVLLDTCTFLWIVRADPHLSATARAVFADPANSIYLSAVSAWEVVVKHQLGRLPLASPPHLYVPLEREKHGIEALDLTEEAVLELRRLPQHHHDPFDRMLICQTIAHGLTLLTPDPQIQEYPVRVVW